MTGITECLQKELPMFGDIKTIIFEPGFFSTQALSPTNLRHEKPFIPDYAQFNEGVSVFERQAYGNEPGDAKKAVELMVDVIKGEGLAKGKSMPTRLPLGTDGLKVMRDKCNAMLKLCTDWEEIITTTDKTV